MVVRARGTHGELVCRPVEGLPPLLAKAMDVVLLPPSFDVDRRQRVTHVVEDGSGQRVRLSGVEDANEAAACVGCTVFASTGELPELSESPMEQDVVGFEVVDSHQGSIGFVKAVEMSPAQPLLVVEREGAEVLIPAVEPILRSIGEARVSVDCPPGLLDL